MGGLFLQCITGFYIYLLKKFQQCRFINGQFDLLILMNNSTFWPFLLFNIHSSVFLVRYYHQ